MAWLGASTGARAAGPPGPGAASPAAAPTSPAPFDGGAPSGLPGKGASRSLDHAPGPDEARGYARPPGVASEDVGLFVPRAILTPPRLVLQVVFLPLQALITVVERNKVAERVIDVLYNDRRTAAIVPTASFLSSFGPTAGLKAFHNDLGGHGEKFEVSAQTGGVFSVAAEVSFRADRLAGSRMWVESVALYERRPQMFFKGIGDDTVESTVPGDPRAIRERTRFSEHRFLALQQLGYTIGDRNKVKIGGRSVFNHRSFGPKAANSDPSIEAVYDTSLLPGFDRGSTTLEFDANVVVDTRDTEGLTSSGAYVEVFAGGVPRFREFGYFHHGLEATGFIDLYRQTRVLVLRGAIEGVEGPTERIPFNELPRLGGPQRLRGYRLDTFRDEKAMTATVEYLYPIHNNLSGALFVDAGRVAPAYDVLFSNLDSLRFGVGGGVLFHTADKSIFSLDVAYGDGINFFFTSNPLRAFHNRERQL